MDEWPDAMPPVSSLTLSAGTVRGLAYIQKYRFLTIPQFARCANFSTYHASEVLRTLERRNGVGYFGFVSIPGHGKTPKVYFLKRKGWELLQLEIDDPEISGTFMEVHQEATWTPQMYHRLRLLDLFISLEVGVQSRPHLHIVETFIEYRRIKGTHVRETTDFVTDKELPEDRIVPDGAFVLENSESGRRGLFLVEMDMGTERIEAPRSTDRRATVKLKLQQYDKYLSSGRFARKYAPFGDFRAATVLFVTYGAERIENIRKACRDLPDRLHQYYRLATFAEAASDLLSASWKSRALADTHTFALVQQGENEAHVR
jgi:hypothetical protein